MTDPSSIRLNRDADGTQGVSGGEHLRGSEDVVSPEIASKLTFSSLTRISDLSQQPFGIEHQEKSDWRAGDYAVGEVIATSRATQIELTSGRMSEVCVGDHIVGALGVREATLEAVGSWQDVGDDLRMHAMTAAGLLGRVTSQSGFLPHPMELQYIGHVVRAGNVVRMDDFALRPPVSEPDLTFPVLMLIGTSMSSGKTTSARVIVRRLSRMGYRVVGAKLTGAGRYRDILAMADAGAAAVLDFVDAGLPSTVCSRELYIEKLQALMQRISEWKPDILVAEAGASPLEPYNGDAAMRQLRDHVKATVLCASDPYAVVGVMKGFGFEPDLISGVATSTSAGVRVIRRLTGLNALNLLDPRSHDDLDRFLREQLA